MPLKNATAIKSILSDEKGYSNFAYLSILKKHETSEEFPYDVWSHLLDKRDDVKTFYALFQLGFEEQPGNYRPLDLLAPALRKGGELDLWMKYRRVEGRLDDAALGVDDMVDIYKVGIWCSALEGAVGDETGFEGEGVGKVSNLDYLDKVERIAQLDTLISKDVEKCAAGEAINQRMVARAVEMLQIHYLIGIDILERDNEMIERWEKESQAALRSSKVGRI